MPRRRATVASPPDRAETLRVALAANDTARAVDAAVELGTSARDLLPEALRAGLDATYSAFRHYEAGRDEEARESLQLIGLASPFLEWKLLLRGLIACATGDAARALDNWSRLKPDRRPARFVAPVRFALDPEFRAAQPVAVQGKLQAAGDRLLGGLLPRFRELQRLLVRPDRLGDAFLHIEALLPELRRERPDLESRLANCCYWTVIHHGEAGDVGRYRKLFGAPTDDPTLARMEALEAEDRRAWPAAQKHWQRYEQSLADLPTLPPADRDRARALVWCRIGRNAATAREPEFGRPRPPMPSRTAEAHFRKAIELAPDLLEAHEQLFAFLRERDKPAAALKAGRQLLKRFPDHGPTLDALSELCQVQGDTDAALEYVRRALAGNPLDRLLRGRVTVAHRLRARQLASAGEFDAARVDLSAAQNLLDGRPNFLLLVQAAALDFKAGDGESAEESMRQAYAVGPRPGVAFAAVAETARLKLPKALKQRFERDFETTLAEPPTGPGAIGLAVTLLDQQIAGSAYIGQKTHATKAQRSIEAAVAANLGEADLVQLCEHFRALCWWTVLRKAAAKGHKRFPRNPFLPYFEALSHIGPERDNIPTWKIEPLLEKARRLAEAAPPDDRLRQLLRDLDSLQEMLAAASPFLHVLNDFFETFDED